MVEVPPPDRDGDDRGQTLLVAAFGLAVMLVTVALVLNTIIFTENLASRGADAGGKDVLQYRVAADHGVGGIVAATNYHANTTSYAELRANIRDGIGNWSVIAGIEQARRARVTGVTPLSQSNGTRIYQSIDRNFTDDTGTEEWTVVSGADGLRDFVVSLNTSNMSAGDRLNVTVAGAGASRYVVLEKTGGGDLSVTVSAGTDTLGSCTVDPGDERGTVAITAGTVEGDPCEALAGLDRLDPPYTVAFNQGGSNRAYGQYTLTVAEPYSAVDTDDLDGTETAQPTAMRVVYSATVEILVHGPGVTFVSEHTVVPRATAHLPTDVVVSATGSGPFITVGRVIVFVDSNGNLLTRTEGGPTVNTYGVDDAQAVSPGTFDLDADPELEVATVDSENDLVVADATGNRTYLRNGTVKKTTLLAVTTWNGSELSVFYANDQDHLMRVSNVSGPETIYSAHEVRAVAGTADLDGDGRRELVWGGKGPGGTSTTAVYMDDDGDVVSTGYSIGSNSGTMGIGQPYDFDGDGEARIPVVTGSNNVALVAHDGDVTKLMGSGSAAKSPLGIVDWDGDGEVEIVFVNANGHLKYIDDVTDGNEIKDVGDDADESKGAG